MRTSSQKRRYPILGVCIALVLVLSSSTPLFATEDRIKVAYISPVELNHPFWGQIVSFMQAVADDLNIDLQVTVSSENRFLLKNKSLKIIKGASRPNYMITSYFPSVTADMVEAGQKSNVGIFVFNANLSDEDINRIGLPREKFKNFVGHMYPDGTLAGFNLTDILLKEARLKKLAVDGKYQVLALRGSDSYARDSREYGLKRRMRSSSDADIIGNMPSDWKRDVANENTKKILSQFPKASVIWAASDLMALGGADAAKELGRTPGKDIVVGGIDWAPEALEAIADGTMTVSLGGHFMEAGWALILLHDYHHGIDFKEEMGTQVLTSMQALTPRNIQQFMKKFGAQDWSQVDFKKFSKKYNNTLTQYDFSLDALLK